MYPHVRIRNILSLPASLLQQWSIVHFKNALRFILFFRDFMDPTMDNTKHILNYLMPIIERVNPEVHDFMQQ